jgi:hypothetical protein
VQGKIYRQELDFLADPLVSFSRRRLLRSTQSFAQPLRIGGTPRRKFFQAIVLL